MRILRFLRVPARGPLFFIWLIGIVACSGGGAKLSPVTGTVLYKDLPAPGALVAFHPVNAKNEAGAQPSLGMAKEDGTFSLSTGREEGAPPGEYVVTVVWYQEAAADKKGKLPFLGGDDRAPVDKLKGAYADRSKSKLTRQIVPGPNQLDPILLK